MNYKLEDQVGFIMRLASQRHTSIFAGIINDDLTPTQFAAMAKLWDLGFCTQNKLGRLTAVDAATIKGVVGRLVKRGFVETRKDPDDVRRLLIELTPVGKEIAEKAVAQGIKITKETLAPLSPKEQSHLVSLLNKIS